MYTSFKAVLPSDIPDQIESVAESNHSEWTEIRRSSHAGTEFRDSPPVTARIDDATGAGADQSRRLNLEELWRHTTDFGRLVRLRFRGRFHKVRNGRCSYSTGLRSPR